MKEYGKWVETMITGPGDLLPEVSSQKERGGIEITFQVHLQQTRIQSIWKYKSGSKYGGQVNGLDPKKQDLKRRSVDRTEIGIFFQRGGIYKNV